MNLSGIFTSTPKIFDISSLDYKKPIDSQLIEKLTNYLSNTGKHKIMLGIYGEINSLIACLLLKQASRDNVIVMIVDIDDNFTNEAIKICKQLDLETYILNRKDAYHSEMLNYPTHKFSSVKNFYHRFVNYHLFIQADIMNAKVIDTLDKSDRLLGTRPEGFYGHFMPFYSLYKSELHELAALLNISTTPSDPVMPDDLIYPDNLMLTYDKVDAVLFLLAEKQLSPEVISQQFNIDLAWIKKLKSHIDKQLFQTSTSQFII